ncbi:MAG: hypothetical protein ACRENI_12010 [Gemmatimonadaceae bacterium]
MIDRRRLRIPPPPLHPEVELRVLVAAGRRVEDNGLNSEIGPALALTLVTQSVPPAVSRQRPYQVLNDRIAKPISCKDHCSLGEHAEEEARRPPVCHVSGREVMVC